MPKKTMCLILLAVSSLAFGQEHPSTQVQCVTISPQPGSATVTAVFAPEGETARPALPCGSQVKERKTEPEPPLPPALPTRELLARGKTLYVESDTFYVKREEMQKGLLKHEEFTRWGLQFTDDPRRADFVLLVRRAAFQNNFPYTLTDRQTKTVLMAGEVNSFLGTVPGKIAAQLSEKLKPFYEAPARPTAPPQSGTVSAK